MEYRQTFQNMSSFILSFHKNSSKEGFWDAVKLSLIIYTHYPQLMTHSVTFSVHEKSSLKCQNLVYNSYACQVCYTDKCSLYFTITHGTLRMWYYMIAGLKLQVQ